MHSESSYWLIYSLMLIAFAAVSIVLGRIRGDSASVIALSTGGYLMFMGALAWSTTMDRQASAVAFLASLGAILFTTGFERGRVAKSSR